MEDNEERLALFAEIAFLAFKVNLETDYCVFFDYSGHVDSVNVEIAESKTRYMDKVASTEFYARYHETGRKFIPNDVLLAKRDHLKSILEECEIPFGAMEPVQEILTTYQF